MSKLRWGALGVAVLSVGLLATPASAAKVVTKFRDKGATAIVTDCPASGPAGTKCIAFVAYASKARFKEDGTVTAFASLGLDKYRVTLTSTGFTTKFLFGGFVDNVQLSVADDLSSASASGVVPIEQCNSPRQELHGHELPGVVLVERERPRGLLPRPLHPEDGGLHDPHPVQRPQPHCRWHGHRQGCHLPDHCGSAEHHRLLGREGGAQELRGLIQA